MTPRHLDNLFSTAYEGEMTPVEEARFDTHMKSCAPCAAAYAEFKATVEALRGLPKARMPLAVHLPSTLPVAEIPTRPRAGGQWFNVGILRRFPATAVAGAFVIVLAVGALLHGNGNPSTGLSTPVNGVAPGAASDHGTAGSGTAASCSIVNITGASPPASFSQEALATDPAQPALHLTLAAPTLKVIAGKPAVVYAQLSVPISGLSNPGTVPSQLPSRAALPCVTVSVGSSPRFQVVAPPVQSPEAQVPGSFGGPAPLPTTVTTGPLFTFTVPAGLPPGTEVHVTATVPAGYASAISPTLTAELTLTTS
jgi:hypothetical protein